MLNTIGFLGCGNMGGAIARAVCKAADPQNVWLANRTAAKAEALAAELGCNTTINDEVAGRCDLIFLAVKPQMMEYCTSNVTAEEEAEFLKLMAPAGRLDAVPESLIDAASCVSGCGPAWVYQFIEALADGGVACGLPRAKAQEYAAQMVLGSAKLVLESGQHPGALKDAVCSPGGSTIQGVRVLEEKGLRGAVMDAVIASYNKTKEMGKG